MILLKEFDQLNKTFGLNFSNAFDALRKFVCSSKYIEQRLTVIQLFPLIIYVKHKVLDTGCIIKNYSFYTVTVIKRRCTTVLPI